MASEPQWENLSQEKKEIAKLSYLWSISNLLETLVGQIKFIAGAIAAGLGVLIYWAFHH